MNTTNTYDDALMADPGTSDARPIVIAAVFTERERAHDAVHRLHDEGFRDTWIGVTRFEIGDGDVDEKGSDRAEAGEMRVESANWFMRFFGEGDESLHDALVRHGVDEADARAAGSSASTLPEQSAILTVDGGNHPELAAELIAGCGGRLITRGLGAIGHGAEGAYDRTAADTGDAAAAGTSGMSELAAARAYTGLDGPASTPDVMPPTTASTGKQAPSTRTTSLLEDGVETDPADADTTSYDDYGRYRAGKPIDESTRLQLRAERLRVDKSRAARDDATVGTQTVIEPHELDVPFVREELFVERRPVSR